MIDAKNEFETIPAWELITGSSDGGFTNREMAADIIKAAESCSLDIGTAWQDLATTDDEDINPDEYVELLDGANIPPSCSLYFDDNELRLRPFIDDEIPRFDDYPEAFTGDDVSYIVNDHGNVTCQEWTGTEYRTVWEMV